MTKAATVRSAQLLSELQRETEASQKAVLSSDLADLQLHTRTLEELSRGLKIELCSTIDPDLMPQLTAARSGLRVYRAVLRRAAKYCCIQSNVLALCAKECSYNPDRWSVAALQPGR